LDRYFYYKGTKIIKYRIFLIFAPLIKAVKAAYKFKAMKYLVRSVKYFFYFAIITTLVLLALVYTGMAESTVEGSLKGGYNDLWKMGLFFAAVAAVYPKLAFINRKLYIGQATDIEPVVIDFLRERRYILEDQTETTMSFRLKGTGPRMIKMCEDRITITRTLDGYYMEGLRKDVLRLASGLEYKFLNKED
jgi:hypothetical protein